MKLFFELVLVGFVLVSFKSTYAKNVEADSQRIRRYGIIIGKNDGGKGRLQLKYAATDAENFSKVMKELGGLNSSDEILLINPSQKEVLEKFTQMKKQIAQNRSNQTRSELFVYYSGHSDDRGLLVGEDRITYKDFKKAIENISSDIAVIVVDSCSSGSLTRVKGGQVRPPFLNHSLSKLKGYVVLTSSSAKEAAQESDRIKGSYFTHYLVSGLRGAADFTSENRVTLNHAYQYAYHQTLARTESALSGPQHPSYNIQLSGSGELIVTDTRQASARLVFPGSLTGHFFVRDQEGRIVTEVNKLISKEMTIGLEPGQFSVVYIKDRKLAKADIRVAAHHSFELNSSHFKSMEVENTTARGEFTGTADDLEDIPNDRVVPAEFAVFPGVSTNLVAPEITENRFNLSLLYASPAKVKGAVITLLGGSKIGQDLSGVQISPFFNSVERNARGVQVGGGYNSTQNLAGIQIGLANSSKKTITGMQVGGVNHSGGETMGSQIGVINVNAGTVSGVQVGGVSVATGNVHGMQISGVSNYVESGTVNGIQVSGLLNKADDIKGLQVSLLNVATKMAGAQIGLFNSTEDLSGVQVGLINHSKNGGGAPIGLINIWPESQLKIDYFLNDVKLHQLALKYGIPAFYTFIQYGLGDFNSDLVHGKGAGFGSTVGRNRFHLDFETLYWRLDRSTLFNDDGQNLIQVRILPRIELVKDFSIFFGPSLNIKLESNMSDFDHILPYRQVWLGYNGGVSVAF